MTVEDLVAALEQMPQTYPVSAGICPDTRYVEDDLGVYESWNFVSTRFAWSEARSSWPEAATAATENVITAVGGAT